MLAAAVDVARAEGLSSLSFGRVARQVGTNDRTVVYYFPTKADLIGAVGVIRASGEDPGNVVFAPEGRGDWLTMAVKAIRRPHGRYVVKTRLGNVFTFAVLA